MDYSTRSSGVEVDLDGQAGDDGEAQEGDSVQTDVEAVLGGAGDDVLVGNSGENALLGGPGRDQLDGAAGEDFLAGDADDDAINSRDLDFDFIECGDGVDSLTNDPRDEDAGDCESVQTAEPTPSDPGPPPPPPPPPPATPPPPPPAPIKPPIVTVDRIPPVVRTSVRSRFLANSLRNGIKLVITCSEACSTSAVVKLSARDARRLGFGRRPAGVKIGQASTPPSAGAGSFAVRIRPLARVRARLARARRVSLTVTMTVRDRSGNARTVTTALSLRR